MEIPCYGNSARVVYTEILQLWLEALLAGKGRTNYAKIAWQRRFHDKNMNVVEEGRRCHGINRNVYMAGYRVAI